MGLPAADLFVDEGIVRALIVEQFPDLAGLPLHCAGEGFDNYLWRLGESLLVRLPRRRVAVHLARHEIRWLAELAPRLSLPVPVPLRVGRESELFAHPWIVTTWYEGDSADRATLADHDVEARRLAAFLRALHVPSPPEAPVNKFRCIDMATRSEAFDLQLDQLGDEVDETAVRRVWRAALASEPWLEPPVWIHGDLHPGNLVVKDGSIVAVVDFGDACAGDPATDLAGAWMLLTESAVDSFLDAYESSETGLVARSLGWAALFGLFAANIGNDGAKLSGDVGRRTLERVISYSKRVG